MSPESPWDYILCMPELQNIDIEQYVCPICGIAGVCHCQQISPDTTMPTAAQSSLNPTDAAGVELPDIAERVCYSADPTPQANPFSPGQINASSSTSGMRVSDPSMVSVVPSSPATTVPISGVSAGEYPLLMSVIFGPLLCIYYVYTSVIRTNI